MKRKIIQIAAFGYSNAHLLNYKGGKIYQGKWKRFCNPGLNCYSCPAAGFACPIGALQAVNGSMEFQFSFYVAGVLLAFGVLLGRAVCGWLCPFGLIQDLLHKIPFPKKIKVWKGDRLLRKLKYVILLLFVILLPLCVTDVLGQGAPYFCKLICPAGTLEGGIPLVLLNNSMRSTLGWLYLWKNTLLLLTILLAIIIYRPFCKYICPLGAVYSLFNPISVFRYQVDKEKCTGCGACKKACGMQIDPVEEINHPECIHCGQCKNVCRTHAIYQTCMADKTEISAERL